MLTIFGTRPEAIKLAPVIVRLQNCPIFQSFVCVTAQHRQMLDQVLNVFGIRPDDDLDLMLPDQTLCQFTAEATSRLEPVLRRRCPNVVLVQGDTSTAMVGALSAFYHKIPVGHVEAGLRTRDKYNPFPEEANRRIIDTLADWCFAPTEQGRQNLLSEGCSPDRVFVTGNTGIDALMMALAMQSDSRERQKLEQQFIEKCGVPWDGQVRLILVTGHRRESFGEEFENICFGLKKIAESNPDVRLVYPVHLNPHVRKPVLRILGNTDRVHLIEPVDYSMMVWLLSRCYFVLTDSGGIQEEAPTLGKPVLVMRKVTERPEGVDAGVSKVVGTDAESIFCEAQRLLHDARAFSAMAHQASPYGDGQSAERILQILQGSPDISPLNALVTQDAAGDP